MKQFSIWFKTSQAPGGKEEPKGSNPGLSSPCHLQGQIPLTSCQEAPLTHNPSGQWIFMWSGLTLGSSAFLFTGLQSWNLYLDSSQIWSWLSLDLSAKHTWRTGPIMPLPGNKSQLGRNNKLEDGKIMVNEEGQKPPNQIKMWVKCEKNFRSKNLHIRVRTGFNALKAAILLYEHWSQNSWIY